MHTKCFFRNEPTSQFSEVPAFSPKSSWKLPKGHPKLEVFLSQMEKEIFKMSFDNLKYSNTSKEDWQEVIALADDHTIVIKWADEGSCVIAWDRMDYLLEAKKQLSDRNFHESIDFKEKLFSDLVESSKNMFLNLEQNVLTSQKELKHSTCEFKKSPNLGKLYFLKSINVYLLYLKGHLFPTAIYLLKKRLNL